MSEGYIEFHGHAPDLLVVTLNMISVTVCVLPVIEHLGTCRPLGHPSLTVSCGFLLSYKQQRLARMTVSCPGL